MRHALSRLTAICLVSFVGCSGGLESSVSGTVTLNGKAIGPGSISFVPQAGEKNPAIGTVLADGSYFLKSSRTEGLAAGKYRVSLYIHEVPPDMQPGQRLNSSKSLIPEKYESSTTSGLEFDVKPGRNTIDIPLVGDATGPKT